MRIASGGLGLLAAVVVTCAGCTSAAPIPPPATVTVATPSPVAPPASPSPSDTSTTPPTSGPCRLDALRPELSAPRGGPEGGQDGAPAARTVDVVWTNASQATCTMDGFVGADLQRSPADRADLPESERGKPDRFSLARSDEQPALVRLAPGEKAHSTITYQSSRQDVSAFRADQLLATPPGETHSAVLTWADPFVLRDRATIGPTERGTS